MQEVRRTLAFGKIVQPFEWVQETQGRQQASLRSQITPCFISRLLCCIHCSDCPLWKQAVSLLEYHLSKGSIVSPPSAPRSRNSSVVRLFRSLLQETVWTKYQLLLCQPGLSSNTFLQGSVPLQTLMLPCPPPPSLHTTYSGCHFLNSENVTGYEVTFLLFITL